MKVGENGWLMELLAEAEQTHLPAHLEYPELRHLPARARARLHIRNVLHSRGVRYGTPSGQPPAEDASSAPEERLFLAVLRNLAWLALEVADLVGAPKQSHVSRLLVLFAALTGLVEEAAAFDARLLKGQPLPKRGVIKLEAALEQRAISLAGDPVYGLVLHNGAVYVDARCFGQQATEYFLTGRFVPARAVRRQALAAAQKALLVEVLTALACAERTPSFASRRAILRQIEDLRLPDMLAHHVRSRVRQFFERKPALASVVRRVHSRDTRRFLLEQTLLASLVDGRRSSEELAFVQELARALRFAPDEVKRVEVDVAEFYRKNRSVVDVFTVAAGAQMMGEELLESMQHALEKNFHRLLREVKETGELSVLLTQAARGRKLTGDEKRKVRAQLIDVAKAIPALAIFAAPGGVLLLIALAKVLPFNLLPSAFQDDEEDEITRAPRGKMNGA